MSVRLMVKAMRLFEDESKKGTNVKKTSSGQKHKKGRIKRLNQNNSSGDSVGKSKKIKSVVDEYRRKQMGDMTEDNLYILQRLSALKPKTEAANKILEHHTKKLNKNIPTPSEPEECEPKSILFPEENKHKKKRKNNECT